MFFSNCNVKGNSFCTRLFLISALVLLCQGHLLGQNHGEMAQAHIRKTTRDYKLTKDDLASLLLKDNYSSILSGIQHVYLQQAYRGIGIYHANLSVHFDAEGKVIQYHNAAIVDISSKVNSPNPSITAYDAIVVAANIYGLGQVENVAIVTAESGPEHSTEYSAGNISQEPIPLRLMYMPVESGELRLVWDLSIYPNAGDHWWSLRVDAHDGKLLDAYDWTVECDFGGHRPHLESFIEKAPVPMELYALPPAPNSYTVYAAPVESPNHGSRTIETSPWLLSASPFGWHDTNGASGAEFTITRGNNVYAQEDQDGNNGTGFAPNGGASLDFDFPVNLANAPSTYTSAAITNLFYWNNLIHDVCYGYGFDEPSGNFQQNNYGNGGAASDYVRADGQDGGGMNNANMSTPPDGSRPRMQMYLWAGQSTVNFLVNSPPSVAGAYTALEAAFGPGLTPTPLTGNLVLVDDGSGSPTEACSAIQNGSAISGNIAVIDRGNCTFVSKIQRAESVGAIACVVCNNVPGLITMAGGGAINIPSVMISQSDCALIRAQLSAGVNITMSNTGTVPDRDGDFDNGIIVHEYVHGISNRLTGGPNNTSCLGNAEHMGEGWSDWFAVMMTMEPGDLKTDPRGIGTYAKFQPTTGLGIRPAPYSTDMGVNGFTYGNISNTSVISRPHGIGFLWCTMLWEMNWMLIEQYGFDADLASGTGGNNVAMALVMEAMKLQPCSPGFVDGRDAILLADQSLFAGAHRCLIWTAFAKRGLGFSATQGSTNNRSDGSQAFDLPSDCSPFPVDWLDISAKARQQEIELSWTVASELENRGFEIQRRDPEQSNFEAIANVKSRGNTTIERSYSFLDQDVLPSIDYFYRLKQTDQNGAFSYSETVMASINAGLKSLRIFPNPSKGILNIEFGQSFDGPTKVTVLNMMGQKVSSLQLADVQANSTFTMDLGDLPPGNYLMRISSGLESTSRKVVLH